MMLDQRLYAQIERTDWGCRPVNHLAMLSSIDEESLRASGSVFVVAGAITSGRKLLDVSRKLRSSRNQLR